MKEMVLGFLFSEDLQRVVMIRKTHPEWQRGRQNGIGGHNKPGEYSAIAMAREFEEETGLHVHPFTWSHYARLELWKDLVDDKTPVSIVEVFAARGDVDAARTTTDEVVEVENVRVLHAGRGPGSPGLVENVPWLVGLAVDHLTDGRPAFSTILYLVEKEKG